MIIRSFGKVSCVFIFLNKISFRNIKKRKIKKLATHFSLQFLSYHEGIQSIINWGDSGPWRMNIRDLEELIVFRNSTISF